MEDETKETPVARMRLRQVSEEEVYMKLDVQSLKKAPLLSGKIYMRTVSVSLLEKRNARGVFETSEGTDTLRMVNVPLEVAEARDKFGNFDVNLDNLSLSKSGKTVNILLDQPAYNVYYVDANGKGQTVLMSALEVRDRHERAMKAYLDKNAQRTPGAEQKPKEAEEAQPAASKPLPAVAEKMETPSADTEVSEAFISDDFFDI